MCRNGSSCVRPCSLWERARRHAYTPSMTSAHAASLTLELEQLQLRACRYEEYVPRKKRREADEAVLLRLQGVSVRHCSSRQTRQHLEH
jgi:hypothetical protein